ncbi:MAG TPA: hypothetical protein VFU41_15860 [Gemmatimonadales bacterium]|nr:hypothetical protein [Gemmatimonadales bacterium]
MLSILHTSARAALVAGLVGAFALAVPVAARAQSVTSERALLNRLDATPRGTVAAFTQVPAAAAPVEQGFLDGERALLNRSRTAAGELAEQPEIAQPGLAGAPYAHGVRALLNRSSL